MIEPTVILPPPPHPFPTLAPIVEACAWCESRVLSCLACIECLELFCCEACHHEYVAGQDELQRSRNAAAAEVRAVN